MCKVRKREKVREMEERERGKGSRRSIGARRRQLVDGPTDDGEG